MPAARMSARGMRQLATVVTSVSLSVPKGIHVSQMREASVFVASPIVTYSASLTVAVRHSAILFRWAQCLIEFLS